MAEIKAKKVIFKNRDGEYLLPMIEEKTGLVLFDTILKDHVLTYEESKGLALQGTYVYKEAVAGSRYGYPDFYAKCLEERNTAIAIEVTLGGSTITMYINSNGHQFFDIADKDIIDAFFDATGMAWMYGIDQENERIFLPRNVWFEQISIDDVGKAVEAGLPNITGKFFVGNLQYSDGNAKGGAVSGAFTRSLGHGTTGSNWNANGGTYSFDASRSNAIYGKSNTVQPNAVKKLLYICVGNTEAHRLITDVVDVTTTENDTIPFGYSTYQKNAQPSLSWLKSEGQWNDGNVYETFYNWSVNKLGEAFASGYIKQVTETFDDYDLVINQDNMTFRLPLLDGSEDLPSDKFISLDFGAVAVGNYTYTAPCNGFFITRFTGNDTTTVLLFVNGTPVDKTKTTASQQGTVQFPVKRGDNIMFSVQTTALKSIEGQGIVKAQGNGSLYFKVGNAVQNLQIIDTANLIENYTTKSMADGQWISKELIVSEAVAIGDYTLDLSDYLPNDGYMYEVWGHVYLSRGGDSGTNTNVYIYDGFGERGRIAHTMADGANFQQSSCGFLLTVDTERKMRVEITTLAAAACVVYLFKYRRLGTNQ